jgi:ethanolamine permease
VLGFSVLMVLFLVDPNGSGTFGGVILNMAVFGAVIAYVMQMAAYILLKRKFAHIERPYRSPLGEFGAWVALVIAAVVLILLFDNPDFRPGIIGVAVWFLCGLLYFAVHGRKTLVYSPEEEFAIEQSQHSGTTP